MTKIRPSAVPLMVFDPYFSIWSFADSLYDNSTKHWTGARNAMTGIVRCGSNVWKFMGELADREYYYCEPDSIKQTNVLVNPTITEYTFENEILLLKVRFINPVLADELLIMSRPLGYIEYEAESKTGEEVEVYFDISAEIAVDNYDDNVKLFSSELGIYCGKAVQNVLNKSGDAVRIDWGYLHLLDEDAYFCNGFTGRNNFVLNKPVDLQMENLPTDGREDSVPCGTKILNAGDEVSVHTDNPVMAVRKKGSYGRIAIAYDDIKCIDYFGKQLDSYYKINGDSFVDMCKKALDEFESVKEKCIVFDKNLTDKAKIISDKYAEIISLSYRQAVAAHKLCFDEEGLLFISKECYSDGCAATVDVTYPSMPLFLLSNPELVKGMLKPIFKYANTDMWDFEFAPHDVGIYPILNKQSYGYEKDDPEWTISRQMPIEECGNMLICTFAICKALGDNSYATENKDLLLKWGEYLVMFGKDPGNQLCTDDFNGHLDRNCNLSIKAIIAIYACGELFGIDEYKKIAEEYAAWWKENALENDHYRMAFGADNTWSIKYNMVWDKIFEFGLFNDVYKTESDFYISKLQKYGIPLDSRGDVAKNDWVIWVSALCDDKDKRDAIVESVWNMVNETKTRVPITDHYDVRTAMQWRWAEYYTWAGFQNRSVVGGFAILML